MKIKVYIFGIIIIVGYLLTACSNDEINTKNEKTDKNNILNNKEYNNPFGRNRSQFSDNMKSNLILFTEKLKSMNVEFLSEPFDKVDLSRLNSEDFVYCDPPYLITTGSYNDGNRGFKDWKEEEEIQLYKVLDELNKRKVKFALSNVIEHKGKENVLLKEWSKKYKTIYLTSDYSNSSYNTKRDKSIEVLIINY